MESPVLWYFADPMCSWCWGFTPAIDTLRAHYRSQMKIALVLGGLRPGTTEAMTPAAREDTLHHWHSVHERTGQPFGFEGALPDGFVYDTEPASRAVIAMMAIDPTQTFALFKAIQQAFYADSRDVTQTPVLAELAATCGTERDAFMHAFDSDAAREKTRLHFQHARKAGVSGFPTLILQRDTRLIPIASGCLPLATVRAAIDAGLSAAPDDSPAKQ